MAQKVIEFKMGLLIKYSLKYAQLVIIWHICFLHCLHLRSLFFLLWNDEVGTVSSLVMFICKCPIKTC